MRLAKWVPNLSESYMQLECLQRGYRGHRCRDQAVSMATRLAVGPKNCTTLIKQNPVYPILTPSFSRSQKSKSQSSINAPRSTTKRACCVPVTYVAPLDCALKISSLPHRCVQGLGPLHLLKHTVEIRKLERILKKQKSF